MKSDLPELNLPRYTFDIREEASGTTIFDPVRRRRLGLSPEEWVRQNFVQFLVHERGFPAGLLSLEYTFRYDGRLRRADIVAFGSNGSPILLVECKSVVVKLGADVFNQVARYNTVVNADAVIVTNGLTHYVYKINNSQADSVGMESESRFSFLDDVPSYLSLNVKTPAR